MTSIDVTTQGATGDGSTDDYPAVIASIRAVDAAGGGTVFFPTGVYALSASLGNGTTGFGAVTLIGDGERASTLLATGDFAPIAGTWHQSRFENLVIDAGGHGAAGLIVDLDKSYIRHCLVRGWTHCGIQLNPNVIGLLNWIDDNFIEQCTGTGIYTTYRFYDSWIVNNNIGSTGPNLSVESGPLRILANHLNGAPRHNVELRGNKAITIVGNLCEGARREAIIYTMPNWLDADAPQVQIVGNNITNGGQEAAGTFPAIGIYSHDVAHRTSGSSVTGNFFACTDQDAGWSYAVDAEYVDNLAITGNVWEHRGFGQAPVRAGGSNVGIAGNSSGNPGRQPVVTLSAPELLGHSGGDRVYLLADGADVTLPTAAGAARYTFRNIGTVDIHIAAGPGERIDRHAAITVPAGGVVGAVSDGSAWWTI